MKVSIIICTYNRQENIKYNLATLNNHCKNFIHHIYVIDNASNLPQSLSNDFISIIPNKNLGGSGGYARGMYEAKKDKETTHIILMDDDIKFEPDVLQNAISRLNDIDKNDWLAFGMRTFEKPNIIYENTAFWNGIRPIANHRGYNLIKDKQWKRRKCNYAAWWSLIMPISVIDKYRYPMPYFIKSDDVEYALRRRNETIHCFKDISILHEDFDKKYNHYIEYYNIRNYLITNAIHLKHSLLKSWLMYVLRMGKSWLTGNFKKIKLANIGLKDFLLGPSCITNTDLSEKNTMIRDMTNKAKINLINIITFPFIVFFNSLVLVFKYRRVRKQYLDSYQYLTSEAYWEKQFNS
ncbi:MAG: glycosyltransferase [Bacilli bacterium]|nr:glycosyltransferase [Bacilli bacterium]